MTCKGICTRHKAIRPRGARRYSTGQKRCQICNIFIKWEGLYCSCCGYRIRSRPRHFTYKEKFRAHMAKVEAAGASITKDATDNNEEKLAPVVTV